MTEHASRVCVTLMCGTLACVSILSAAGLGRKVGAFDPKRNVCALSNGRIVNPYQIASFMVLPGERLQLRLEGLHHEGHRLAVNSGTLVEDGENGWFWTAPTEPGIYPGVLRHEDDGTRTELNFIVLVPMSAITNGSINGYRIGSYPTPMANRESFYKIPRGFIELTAENQDTSVSPHFKLGQFPSKQGGSFPKYAVLNERLLIGLEAILEAVNQRGFLADTLFVMSGYRTPAYNRTLGNVVNSRHVFGDAADIFVDQDPVNGIMDDLDRNGRIGPGDNRILAEIVEEALYRTGSNFVGGMGLYPANSAHGPFVHVDLRGYRARW